MLVVELESGDERFCWIWDTMLSGEDLSAIELATLSAYALCDSEKRQPKRRICPLLLEGFAPYIPLKSVVARLVWRSSDQSGHGSRRYLNLSAFLV